jgi:hypothetical protein
MSIEKSAKEHKAKRVAAWELAKRGGAAWPRSLPAADQ